MVCSATRRARHAATSPATTRPHSRGSRCASSTACPTYRFPASGPNPTAAANSAAANSDTNGAPGPAIGTPRPFPNTSGRP